MFSWTDEAKNDLKELWEGGGTARECSNFLSSKYQSLVTRNAIVGKAHRMGYVQPGTANSKKRNGVRIRRKSSQSLTRLVWGDQTFKATQPQNNAPVNGSGPVSRNLTLFQLSDGLCKYATTDSLPHLFCGAPSRGSWCDFHAQLIWVHPPRRERRPYHE